MIKTQKKLTIVTVHLLIFLSSFSIAWAQNEPRYTSLLQGDSIYVGKTLTVQDSVFFDPSLKPTILQTNAVTNMISFRINEYTPLALPDSFEVTIKIRLIATTKDNILDSATEKTLILNYNKLRSYKNKDIIYLQDAYQMQVRILQVTSKYAPLDKILEALELENKIEIDRAYVMNPVTGNEMDCSLNAIKKITGDVSMVEESGELKVTWAADRIIEMYDVEWAYIDKSALSSNKYGNDGQLITELLFKNQLSDQLSVIPVFVTT